MIYELPTRSPIRYSGLYPNHIRSWSYSRSPSQQAIADFLGMKQPVHIELYGGYRYIADIIDLKPESLKLNVSFFDVLDNPNSEPAFMHLSQSSYDQMLERVRAVREAA